MSRKSKRFCRGGESSTGQHYWVHAHGRTVRCKFCTRTKVLSESDVHWGKLERIKTRESQDSQPSERGQNEAEKRGA